MAWVEDGGRRSGGLCFSWGLFVGRASSGLTDDVEGGVVGGTGTGRIKSWSDDWRGTTRRRVGEGEEGTGKVVLYPYERAREKKGNKGRVFVGRAY